MIEANNNNENTLKRTHKKPYKVGKLFFGRTSNQRGASWAVSASSDLSSPLATFEVGKLARAYCEEQRDIAKAAKASGVEVTSDMDTYVDVPAEVGLPTGDEPLDTLEDIDEEEGTEGFVQI